VLDDKGITIIVSLTFSRCIVVVAVLGIQSIHQHETITRSNCPTATTSDEGSCFCDYSTELAVIFSQLSKQMRNCNKPNSILIEEAVS